MTKGLTSTKVGKANGAVGKRQAQATSARAGAEVAAHDAAARAHAAARSARGTNETDAHTHETLRAYHTRVAGNLEALARSGVSAAERRERTAENKTLLAAIPELEARLSGAGKGGAKAGAKASAPKASARASRAQHIPLIDSWLRTQADPTDPREALHRAGSPEQLYEQLRHEPTGVLARMAERVTQHGRIPSVTNPTQAKVDKLARYIVDGLSQTPKASGAKASKAPATEEERLASLFDQAKARYDASKIALEQVQANPGFTREAERAAQANKLQAADEYQTVYNAALDLPRLRADLVATRDPITRERVQRDITNYERALGHLSLTTPTRSAGARAINHPTAWDVATPEERTLMTRLSAYPLRVSPGSKQGREKAALMRQLDALIKQPGSRLASIAMAKPTKPARGESAPTPKASAPKASAPKASAPRLSAAGRAAQREFDAASREANGRPISQYLREAAQQYHTSAPQTSRYLEELSQRIATRPQDVNEREVHRALGLYDATAYTNDKWMQGNYAQNYTYKTRDLLGMDTTGWSDF